MLRNLPPVSIRKCYHIILFVVEHRYDSLSNHVNTYRQAEELRFCPDVSVEGNPLLLTFGIECGYCIHTKPNSHYSQHISSN